jgi:hypothetical protein
MILPVEGSTSGAETSAGDDTWVTLLGSPAALAFLAMSSLNGVHPANAAIAVKRRTRIGLFIQTPAPMREMSEWFKFSFLCYLAKPFHMQTHLSKHHVSSRDTPSMKQDGTNLCSFPLKVKLYSAGVSSRTKKKPQNHASL